MKREILFKAKNIFTGQWVFGHYFNYNGDSDHYINDRIDGSILIDKDTLCQFTGLLDKNGNKIFEGDKVVAWSEGLKGEFLVKWRQESSPMFILFPAWHEGRIWSLHGVKDEEGNYTDDVEIFGNIHD